jgi:hypothetical protein
MNKEVIEAIANRMEIWLAQQNPPTSYKDTAQAILDLKYKCKECANGFKYKFTDFELDAKLYKCPTCKGTGLGEPMIGVLSEHQELPIFNEVHPDKNEWDEFKEGFESGINTVLKQGWRKVE